MTYPKSRCQRLVVCGLVLAGVWASAQSPTIDVGPDLGSFGVGPMEIPLTATGGTPPYTWSVTAGALPAGLSLHTELPSWYPAGASAGIVGVATTPQYSPAVSFTLTVTDAAFHTASKACTVKIVPLSITDPWQLPQGYVGVAYSYTMATANSSGSVSWQLNPTNSLPPGLVLDATSGEIHGSPTTTGGYNFNIGATDVNGTVWRGYHIDVSPLRFTSSLDLGSATVGLPFNALVQAAGGTPPYTFSVSGLPDGLQLSSAGIISGTPTSGGWTAKPIITVTDSGGATFRRPISLAIVGSPTPPSVSYQTPVYDAAVGETPVYTLSANGGKGPYTWSVSGSLPPGMRLRRSEQNAGLSPADLEIAGSPWQTGTYTFTVNLSDSSSPAYSVAQPFTIRVKELSIQSPATATRGTPYSGYLRPLGGQPPYQWQLTQGSLPNGLTLNPTTGIISGTPLENGDFSFFVIVTPAAGSAQAVGRWHGLYVNSPTAPAIQINPTPGDALVNSYYNHRFNICCATGAVVLSISGSLPPGLSLQGQNLLGTPTVAGRYPLEIRATDAADASNYGVRQITLNVSPLRVSTPTPLGFAGSSYSTSWSATGGSGGLTWTVLNSLPPGLTMASNGTLAGIPTSAGAFDINYKVTDGAGNSFTSWMRVTLYGAGTTPAPQIEGGIGTLSTGMQQHQLVATGGDGSYVWNLVSGTLPPGLRLRTDPAPWFPSNASAGVIGVATTTGDYPFTLSVTSAGRTAYQYYPVRITALSVKDDYRAPDAFVGQPYSYTLTALNGAGPVTWAADSDVPPGLTISAGGVLSGTPTADSSSNINFRLSDGVDTIYRNITLNVYRISVSSPGQLPNATMGTPYNYTFSASGGSGTYTWTANSLPNGMVLSSTGTLSGTPTWGPGRWAFNVTATDGNHVSYSKQMALIVIGTPPMLPAISADFLSDCTFSAPCMRVVNAWGGGRPPFNYTVTGLPTGMSARWGSGTTSSGVTPNDLELWGSPQATGDFSVQVTATDQDGISVGQVFPLHVSKLEREGSDNLPGGTRGVAYSKTIRVIGGTPPYTAQKIYGMFPAGLTLTGMTLAGTPLENGGFNPIMRYTDSAGEGLSVRENFGISGGTSTLSVGQNWDLGTFTVGLPVNYQLNGCCAPSYTWSAGGGSWPPGISLNTTGMLVGTPTTTGVYSFLVQVADGSNPANVGIRQLVMTVTTMNVTTSYSLPYGNVGTSYNQPLTGTGGSGALNWALVTGYRLPPGLALDASTGVIGGTPTAAGYFDFRVLVTDGSGQSFRASFSINIYGAGGHPPLNLPLSSNMGPWNLGVQRIQLQATGGVPPYHYSLTPGAPTIPGLRVQDGAPLPTSFPSSVTGGLIGLVATPGVYSSSIRVTDSESTVFDRPFTLNISPLRILSPYQLPKATLATPYSYTLAGFGGSGNYSFAGSNLPAGLTVSSAGVISGSPTAAGNYTISVTITDVTTSGNLGANFQLVVDPFAIATGGQLPRATVNSAYSQTLIAPSCGTGCSWSIASGGLPGGLSLNSSGVFSGTPTGLYNSSFTVQATGSAGTVQKVFSIQVAAATPQPLYINNSAAQAYTPVSYGVTTFLNAQGGTPPYSWSLASGSLPPGVRLVGPGETLSSTLVPGGSYLQGTMMQAGSYTFTVKVTDAASNSYNRTMTLVGAVLALDNNSLPFSGTSLRHGAAYSQQLLALGGSGSYPNWSDPSTPPAGLATGTATGIVAGTPAVTGSWNNLVQVVDSTGNTLQQSVSYNISAATGTALNIGLGPDLGTVAGGYSISWNLNPSGGTGPYTFTALSALPPGLALETGAARFSNASSLYVLGGNPIASGTFTFLLRVDDAAGNYGVRQFTLRVAPFTLFTNTNLVDASVGTPYNETLVSWDNSGTVSYALVPASALPPGLNLVGNSITGTPTTAGNYSFTLVLTDSSGLAQTWSFNLRVSTISLTSPFTIPQAVVGTPYSYTFGATGGGTKTWSATGLPNGFSMSPAGVLSGLIQGPSGAGRFNLTVTVTDGASTIARNFTLYVRFPSPTLLTFGQNGTVFNNALVNQSFSATLWASGGTPPYTWALASGSALPPGLTLLSGSTLPQRYQPGTTLLAGAPSTVGNYSFDLIATDSAGKQIRRTFTLKVCGMGILNGSLPLGTVNTAYAFQFTAVGGTPPYSFSFDKYSATAPMFPPGVTGSASGLLSGTPTAGGDFGMKVTVQDSVGSTFTMSISYAVNNSSGWRITGTDMWDVPVGTSPSWSLYTNGSSTYSWSVTPGSSLPPGLYLASAAAMDDPTGTLLGGQPTTPGNYTFRLRATDTANASNFVDREYTLRISPMQFVWRQALLPAAHVGSPYSFQFQIAGGTPPYSFSIYPESLYHVMPPGLTLSGAGALSGTPTASGIYTVFAIVQDAAGAKREWGYNIHVLEAGANDPLQAGGGEEGPSDISLGVPMLHQLDQMTTGGVPPFIWTLSPGSSLPAGLALLPGSAGVPSYAGGITSDTSITNFGMMVTDAVGQTAVQPGEVSFTPLSMTPWILPAGTVGTPYSASLNAGGGTAPYNFQLAPWGSLPPGMTLSTSGTLSGTPQYPGYFTVSVILGDSAAQRLRRNVALVIDNAIGQSPALGMTPAELNVNYVLSGAPPAAVPLQITSSSGHLPFTAMVSGIPGATLSATSGTTPATINLILSGVTVGVGTHAGVIAVSSPASINVDVAIPFAITATAPSCSYTLNPTAGSAPASGGSGGFSVATGAGCAWSAASSDAWITLTSGAGPGPGTVNYSVSPNLGLSARTGTIAAGGQNYTVTQFGSSCSFAINPPQLNVTSAGGSALINVTASNAACPWIASGLGATPASGTGNGTLTVTIPSTASPSAQVLTATIAGQTLTVNQSGISCTVTLGASTTSADAAGGSGSVAVTTPAGCPYATAAGPSWITINSGGSGTGPGALAFSVAANSTTVARSGTLTIGGQPFVINQAGIACSVTVDASLSGSPYNPGGGAGTLAVTANGANCSWNAASGAGWASVAPAAGTGNGTINVTVTSNSGSTTSRTANLTIAGQTLAVTQAGTTCSYALTSTASSVPAAGGTGTLGVVAPGVCNWSGVSNQPTWLTVVSSGSAGTGNVVFSVQPNAAATPRTGTLSVAGQTVTVTQAAAPCSYLLTPATSGTVSSGGATSLFTYTPSATGCTPAPLSYSGWITVAADTANKVVSYTVAPNPLAVARSGVIQIGEQMFPVTQSGASCGYSLNAYGAAFPRAGGAGSVLGSPNAVGCTPAYGTSQPSFINLGALSGQLLNIFTLPYSVTSFNSLTGGIRRGTITFGGQIFNIKQTSW